MEYKIGILALILISLMVMVNAQCSVSSVYFDVSGEKVCAGCAAEKKTLYAGGLGISLVVETSGCADGTRIKFELYQDTPSGDVLRKTIDYPDGVTIKSNKANTTWKPEWSEDTSNNDGDDNPEYYLKAYVEGDGSDNTTGAGVDWNIKARQTVTGIHGPKCSVEYTAGYIKCVKIHVLDVPTWGSWWSGLWTWIDNDELYINTTFENIDSHAHDFRIDLYDATGENRVACAPWDFWSWFNPFSDECTEVTVNPGETHSWAMDTGKSFVPGIDDPTKTLFSFNGMIIIKLVDVSTGEVVEERTIPIYYENLTIFNESDDEARNVSDPFSYTHHLILDASCDEAGGDFTAHGVYKKQAFPGGFWDMVGAGLGSVTDAITGKTIENPLPICEVGQEYGVVDAEVWLDIETELSGNSLHYLLNQQEYANFDTTRCEDYDYRKNVIVHESQYARLAEVFFEDEEFYDELIELYLYRFGSDAGVNVETIDATGAEAIANRVYCFKTHLEDTRICYELNRDWYSLADRSVPSAPLEYDYWNGTFYRTPYFDDIKRWNHDQKIEDIIYHIPIF